MRAAGPRTSPPMSAVVAGRQRAAGWAAERAAESAAAAVGAEAAVAAMAVAAADQPTVARLAAS